jgi:hypothetical protein
MCGAALGAVKEIASESLFDLPKAQNTSGIEPLR